MGEPPELTQAVMDESETEAGKSENTQTQSPPARFNGMQLSTEELISKSIAPVKKEFLRPPPTSRSTTSDSKDDYANSEAPRSSGMIQEKKSKRQLKRERHEVLFLSLEFTSFILFHLIEHFLLFFTLHEIMNYF